MSEGKLAITTERQRIASEGTPGVPAHNEQGTNMYTFFTVPGENTQLFSAQGWLRVRLMLTSAGPVDVSTRQNVTPVLSGRGITLQTNVEAEFVLGPADRLYAGAASVNRVNVTVEPIPWLKSIVLELDRVGREIVASIAGRRAGRRAKNAASASNPLADCPPPPGRRG